MPVIICQPYRLLTLEFSSSVSTFNLVGSSESGYSAVIAPSTMAFQLTGSAATGYSTVIVPSTMAFNLIGSSEIS